MKLAFFESNGFLFSNWSQIAFHDMENEVRIILERNTCFSPTELYSCIALANVSRLVNHVE